MFIINITFVSRSRNLLFSFKELQKETPLWIIENFYSDNPYNKN